MIEYKTLLVERPIKCPMCDKVLNKGAIMLLDDYRGETLCHYCKDEYEDNVITEEGEDGRLLK